jgi:hypothetical protein
MSGLYVYTDEGECIHPEGATDVPAIREYAEQATFLADLRDSDRPSIAGYLRLIASEGPEQLFVRYHGDDPDTIFEDCQKALETELVNERGWLIPAASDDEPSMLFKRAVLNPAEDPSEALDGTPLAGRLAEIRSAIQDDGEQVTITAQNYRHVADAIRTCADWEIAMAVVDPDLSLSEPQLTFHMEPQPEALAFSESSVAAVEAAEPAETDETEPIDLDEPGEDEPGAGETLRATLSNLRARLGEMRSAVAQRSTTFAIGGVVLALLVLGVVAFASPMGLGGGDGDPAPGGEFVVTINTPSDVTVGSPVVVNYTIENEKTVAGTRTVEFVVDETVQQTREVQLGAAGRTTGQFTYGETGGLAGEVVPIEVRTTAGKDGEDGADSGAVTIVREQPDPTADIGVSLTSAPDTVRPGEQIDIDYEVENTGDARGSRTVGLLVDGTEIDSQTVTLRPGESTNDRFTYTTDENTTGTLSVAVSAGNESEQAETTVAVKEPPEPSSFAVSLDVPAETLSGRSFTATATVENTGDSSSSAIQTLVVDAGPLGNETEAVLLRGGRSDTFTFTFEPAAALAGRTIDITARTEDDEVTRGVTVREATAVFDVAVENTTVQGGEQATVDVTVENTGVREGTQTISVNTGRLGFKQQTVTLAPGEVTTATVAFETGPRAVGTYPIVASSSDTDASAALTVEAGDPLYAVEITGTNSPVKEGDALAVDIAVENVGPWGGEASVTLDGGALGTARSAVSLQPNETEGIALTLQTRPGDVGSYTLTADSTDGQDTTEVTVEESRARPFFLVEELSAASPVDIGAPLAVDATVRNIGNKSGTLSLTVAAGPFGTAERTRADLQPGASVTESVSFDGIDTPGEYTLSVQTDNTSESRAVAVGSPPNFSVSDIQLNETAIRRGAAVSVGATVENTGDRTGTQTVTLAAGAVNRTRQLTLQSGESQRLTFSLETDRLAAGDSQVSLETDDDSASDTLTVTRALTGVEIRFGQPQVAVGERTSVTVTAQFGDGTTADVTNRATFAVQTTGLLSVGGTAVIGEGGGEARLVARYRNQQTTASLTVVELESLSVSVADGELDIGETTSATVRARYTNGTTVDATERATIESVNGRVTVAGSAVTGQAGGQGRVRATVGDQQATAEVTVVGVESLGISLAQTQLDVDESTPVTVTATYTNGTTVDVTARATIESASDVVSVSGSQVTGQRGGEGTVRASFGGQQATAGVSVAGLDSLDITLARSQIDTGDSTSATVTATYTNGTTRDVTEQATVASGFGVASVDGAQVTGEQPGTAPIRAQFRGESASTSLTVVGLDSLDISLAQTGLDVGSTTSATVTATYTNGTTRDVTEQATIESQGGVVSVAGTAVTAEQRGTATVEAQFGGAVAAVDVTVTVTPVETLSLRLAADSLDIGQITTATVEATYANGTTRDVTGQATIESLDSAAAVSGSQVTAEQAGTATVEARFRGAAATASVSVVGLDSIDLSLAETDLEAGDSTLATVTATYTNGTTRDVTEQATIESQGGVVSVAGAQVTAERTGTATIEARFRGQQATADLTVVGLDSLELTLGRSQIGGDGTTSATVTATYTNGTTRDVTDRATIGSRGVAVSVSGAQVFAQQSGTATIEAAFGGEVATATVTVTAGVESVALSLAEDELDVGETTTVTVTATYTNGTTRDVTDRATVESLDSAVSVSGATVTGESGGTATIEAAFGGRQATAGVTVVGLQSLSLSLAETDLDTGGSTPATVTATYTNGTTRDVTDRATVESQSGVASVSGATVTAEQAGTATIEARFRGAVATATVSVVGLESIGISLPSSAIGIGDTATATVTATYTNGTTRDVTDAAGIASQSTAVSVDGAQVTGESAGTATLVATFDGRQTSTDVSVVGVESVTLSLADSEVDVGQTTTATVEATFTNGTTRDVTGGAAIESQSGVASVSGAIVTGESGGTATVEATFGGQTDTASLTVVGLESLSLSLAESTIDAGQTTTATVTAEYTDGSSQDVTDRATIESQSGAASVSGATVTGQRGGEATIEATLGGQQATASLSVVGLQSLDISVGESQLLVDETTDLTVTATYTNGTTQDVTDRATVESQSGVASVSGSQVTGESPGQTTLTTSFDGQQATVALSVAAVESLTLSLGGQEIGAGDTTPATVEATFTNGTTADVTTLATLTSQQQGIATIEGTNVAGQRGGTATIEAAFGGQTDTAEVTVVELASLSLSLASPSIDIGDTTTVTVEATFTNGTTADVTDRAALSNESRGIASIAGAQLTGDSAGTTTITATLRGRQATADLTVVGVQSLTVSLERSVIDTGSATGITVTAAYTNGTSEDVTERATLFSTETTVAEVFDGATGIAALGNNPGTTSIEAEFLGASDGTGLTVQ